MRQRMKVRPDCKSWDVFRLGTDRIVPRRFIISVAYEPETVPRLEITVEMIEGVPQCRGVAVLSTAGGQEVLSRHLRALNIESWIVAGVAEIATRLVSVNPESGEMVTHAVSTEDQVNDTIRQLRSARRGPRRATTDRHREVAEVYRAAETAPTAEVAAHFDVAHRTAALYVQRAREAGYLGPAVKGKAGERS